MLIKQKSLLLPRKLALVTFGEFSTKVNLGHSSQIPQIHVKSKILKSLKYSPFDSLIENRKFQILILAASPSSSDFMAILGIFQAKFKDNM